MKLSKRALGVAPSATLRLSTEIERLRGQGKDVISLLEGEPDLPTPEKIKAATAKALRENRTRYSSSTGLPELKAAIARKLKSENGIDATERHILVANGAKQAIYTALQTLCGPGDEVIIPVPYWVTFPEAVRLAGAAPVFVAPRGHQLDLDKIAKAVTPRTKLIIVNSPNNPTGAVYPEQVLREIARLARKHHFFILSDEAYEHFIYDGLKHASIASFGRDAARRTVTVNTFSKTFSMTGFRIGYLAAAPEITRAAANIHSHLTGNVCTFAQYGAIAALKLGRKHDKNLREIFEKRRDSAFAAAAKIFDCLKPRGAFYLFPDARRYLGKRFKDSAALAWHLLNEAGVAVVPGSACGWEGHLRLSFSGSEENTRLGLARIAEALCR